MTPALRAVVSSPKTAIARLFARAGISGYYSANQLERQIVVKKLHATIPEFAVYTQLSPDAVDWCRWFFTNRFNTSAVGATRMSRCSVAKLYVSTDTASAVQNLTTGTEGQAPVSTQATAAVTTRAGAWTGPATVGGVTDIIYSTTIADKATYTVSGVSRLVWRAYRNTTNGGIVKVTVKAAGVEIAAGKYLVPLTGPDRVINLKDTVTGQFYTPIAEGLDTGTTYTVDIEVHSTNPAGGRAYDGGMRLYAATAYNATGRHGTWNTATLGGISTEISYDAGDRVTYQIAAATRIDWRYVGSSTAAIASFKVFDANGVEISTYTHATDDTYRNATAQVGSVTVASGLPKGTYYLQVTASGSKNAASTGYRLHDEGVMSYDETTAGVFGTDAFNDQGITDISLTEGTVTLVASGNLELAMYAVKTSESAAGGGFIGGVHGNETVPASLVYKMDGSVIDFAGGAVGATWTGNSFGLTFTTQLQHISDASAFANVSYSYTLSNSGYTVGTTRTLTGDAKVREDYVMMLNVPNTDSGTQGVSGGFTNFAALSDTQVSRAYAAYDNSSNALGAQVSLGMFWNSAYAVVGQITNLDAINTQYSAAGYAGIRALSFVQDRTDKFVKWYDRAFSGSDAGVNISSGDSLTTAKTYRVLKRTA